MKPIKYILENSLFVNVLTLLFMLLGAIQMVKMRREAFPSINFDIAVIRAIYPGASPKEVELYLTIPIEREVSKVDGIDKLESSSIENLMTIIITLDPNLSDGEKSNAINDIQKALDRVSDLPEDLPEKPVLVEMGSQNFPVLELVISAETQYHKLHQFSERLEESIENLTDVSNVNSKGLREREFWIEVDPQKMNYYNLSFDDIKRSINARNLNLPGGSINYQDREILVRTVGEIQSTDELLDVVLRSNDTGRTIRIRDIAQVKDTFEKRLVEHKVNGREVVILQVVKSKNGDILTLVDEVKKLTEKYQSSSPLPSLKISYINDLSKFVRDRLGVLTNNGIAGIILVVIALLLFLSPGIAFMAALGLPVAFLGTMWAMGYGGMTINLVTMFALIIVLGMLVDDAIIVAENIWYHYENGLSPWDAAIKGTTEVFWPVTATILTSIAAFSPLLMVAGIFGKFIRELPLVVMAALSVSLVEAMLVLPAHAYDMLKFGDTRQKRVKEKKHPILDRMVIVYEALLRGVLRFKWSSFVGVILLLVGSLLFARKHIPLILFPSEGIEQFQFRAELPIGYSLDQVSKKFSIFEEVIKKLPQNELENYVTDIGIHQIDGNDPFTQRGSHLAQINVFLSPENERVRSADEIIESLRPTLEKVAAGHGFLKPHFTRKRHGPPVGKPVAIRVVGDSFQTLQNISSQIAKRLEEMPGVYDIGDNYRQGKDEVVIKIDEKSATRSFLNIATIASHIKTTFDGTIIDYMRIDKDRIPIRLLLSEEVDKDKAYLSSLSLSNQFQNKIPLAKVARLEHDQSINAIFHRNKSREITITAALNEKVTTSENVNRELSPFIEEIQQQHSDVTIIAGGEWEDTQESIKSLSEAFIIALILIFMILSSLFKSIVHPFVVMMAIPFSIVGVIWASYFHGIPLSFFSIVGTIGLSGVVVNDSIVLVSFINQNRKKGVSVHDAIINAGKRRFRAVWLTTVTTVFGLLPVVYGIGGIDKLLQPAALALSYGLLFGSFLVLLLVPAIYLIADEIIGFIFKKPFEGVPYSASKQSAKDVA